MKNFISYRQPFFGVAGRYVAPETTINIAHLKNGTYFVCTKQKPAQ